VIAQAWAADGSGQLIRSEGGVDGRRKR